LAVNFCGHNSNRASMEKEGSASSSSQRIKTLVLLSKPLFSLAFSFPVRPAHRIGGQFLWSQSQLRI
jgi:hypothetical protein